MANTQRGRITAALIATAAVGATAAVWMQASTRNLAAIGTMAVAAPRLERTIDARLSGSFPWVPQKWPTPRERTERVSRVIAETSEGPDAESLHASGVARLLSGDHESALTLLRRATRMHPTAPALTDYAAALIAASVAEGRVDYLADALPIVDRALEQEGRLAAALYNRAVIIERLGLRKQAGEAWDTYLAVDLESSWASEARRRRSDSDWIPAQTLVDQRVAAENNFMSGDREALLRFVDEYRQYSRAWVENTLLPAWAEASQKGDQAAAARELMLARAVGKALLSITADPFVSDTVGVIDASTGDDRTRLIAAHLTYRHGRLSQMAGLHAEAEALFARAAEQFGNGNSMAYAARARTADSMLRQQRRTEARTLLRSLRTSEPAMRYPAHQADLNWQLGMAEAIDGYWSAAFVAFRRSAAGYAALGDRQSEARVHNSIASAYASVGNRRMAWRERIVALSMAREDPGGVQANIIATAASGEALGNRPENALSLLELVVDADTPRGPLLFSVHQARLSMWAKRGDRRRAFEALTQARASVNAAPLRFDAPPTAVIERWFQAMEAEIVADTDPAYALTLLEAARPEFVVTERRDFLPRFELQRARALRRLGRADEAIDALVSGIQAVESTRTYVAEDELRTSVLDFAEPLFRELVDVLASIGSTERAFEYADRWRGRTLLDSLALGEGRPPSSSPTVTDLVAALPARHAIVEYVILNDRLLVFCVTRRGVELTTVRISQARLQDLVEHFTASITRATFATNAAGEAAYDVLIRPVARSFEGITTIVFVPDRFLQRVPFAALHDGKNQRYLIEDHSVAVSPSAQLLFTHAGIARRPALNDVLVIGNPDTAGELSKLANAENEARFVAALHPRRSIAIGKDATRERFLDEWATSSVVHYAGHAANARKGAPTASLALSGHEDASFVSVQDIASALRGSGENDDRLAIDTLLSRPATQLVVLAACETFAGRDEHLEGIPTLAHAFLAAGVPAVVGALWKIDDADAYTLFTTFHRHVADGVPAANALRQAQLTMLHGDDENRRHPSSWAGITLAGVPTLTVSR